jgi:ABC-type nitrate/sulfonate/bicarbonate transport system permease component
MFRKKKKVAAATPRASLAGAGIYLRTMTVAVLLWAALALKVGNPVLLPPPWRVAEGLWELALDLELFYNAAISLGRMLVSLAIASLLAIPLGFFMGRSRLAENLVDPLVEGLRPISGIAWIPLALFIFGIGNALPIFIMTYAAFFPIVLGTIAGVHAVDRRLVDVARTMGVPRRTIVTRVVAPAAVPPLLVAVRLGAAAAWTAVVAAELMGAPSGLGYAIEWYRGLLMTPKVMAYIATIGFLGFTCDALLRWLNRVLTPWLPAVADLPSR